MKTQTSATGIFNKSFSLHRGFTLIELLVVVAIIGIMSGGLIIRSGLSPASEVEKSAATLSYLLNLAHEHAILTQQDIGLLVEERGYRFLANVEGTWAPLDKKELRARELPEDMTAIIQTENSKRLDAMHERQRQNEAENESAQNDDDTPSTPQVYFLSSSEILPTFTINLSSEQTKETSYNIELNENGAFVHVEE